MDKEQNKTAKTALSRNVFHKSIVFYGFNSKKVLFFLDLKRKMRIFANDITLIQIRYD